MLNFTQNRLYNLMLLALTVVCWADNDESSTQLIVSGYIKNLNLYAIHTNGHGSVKPSLTGSDLNRIRLKSSLNFGTYWHSEIWLDNEFEQGTMSSNVNDQNGWFNMNWRLIEGDSYNLQQSLPRALLTLETDLWTIVVGRQRIAWGTGFIWNPTDLLNPVNPLAIERAERSSTNALYVSRAIGELSQAELVLAYNDDRPNFATRFGSNWGNYDFSVLVGRFGLNKTVGGDFAGYIGGAGFRGELIITDPDSSELPNLVRFVLNADYNFSYQIYGLIEVHYSNQKLQTNPALKNSIANDNSNVEIAIMLSKSISPPLNLSLLSLFDLKDSGMMIGPTLSFSPFDQTEFILGAYLFRGNTTSQFGLLPQTAFTSVVYHF